MWRASGAALGAVVLTALACGSGSTGAGFPAAVGDDGGAPPPPVDVRQPRNVGDSVVVDLGDLLCGDDVFFAVPKGALGFNVTLEEPPGTLSQLPFGIERIVAPSGEAVHSEYTPKGGTHATSVATGDHIASASVPQGDSSPEDLSGTWRLRAAVPQSPTEKRKVRGRVYVQTSGDGVFHAGTLAVHAFVPQDLLGSNEGPLPRELECRLDAFFAVLQALAGIGRGAVDATVVDASYSTIDSVGKAFELSKDLPDGARVLPILFTQNIVVPGLGDSHGVAAGVPGAANTFGRDLSMIIVSVSSHSQEDVLTMVHEAGHFFGLNHTTELDGSRHTDPLSDTPSCSGLPPTQITDDGMLAGCADRNNIMFARGALGLPAVFSERQKRVLRGSPVYRTVTTPPATPTFADCPDVDPSAIIGGP